MYKWLAAVSLDLGETGLPSVLHMMIPPLQRDISNQSTTQGGWGSLEILGYFYC